MRIADLSVAELTAALTGHAGLTWHSGPFLIRLRALAPQFPAQFRLLYGAHRLAVEPDADVIDFHVALVRSGGLRRWWRPKIHFRADAPTPLTLFPFPPFPLDHALPLFEWGLNFCIAAHAQQYLILHAAVVARGDCALLLPGLPGSGKSTLCAALALRGWRLLSDEFALVRPESGLVIPVPRSISLKNDSIEVLRAFDPAAVIGPVFPKTRKGRVAHLRVPAEWVHAEECLARPVWVVSPRFVARAAVELEAVPKDHAFLRLAGNAFNYELQGVRGFRAVTHLVRTCTFFDLRYGDLEEAVALLDRVAVL